MLPGGQVPPAAPLYVVTVPTNASIGGATAPVLFSGLAPGYAGVYQVNLRVPTGLSAGFQPILLWSGGGVSQDNLSIPVK